MNSPRPAEAVRLETVTEYAGQLTALELLSAWGSLRGPDLRDPRSVFVRRRLTVRGTPVYRRARAARRAAGCCPSATAREDDAQPRESSGVIDVWSANAPPAPLAA